MPCHRSIVLCVCSLSLIGLPESSAQAQSMVMITEDSRLEDASGSRLTHDEFIERMGSGRFTTVPITDDTGTTIGYRLVPRSKAGDQAQGEPATAPRTVTLPHIVSSPIEQPVTVDLVRHHHLFLPIDIHDGTEWRRYRVLLDTGTFVPLILDPELGLDSVQRARIADVEFSQFSTGRFEPFGMIRDMNRYLKEKPDLFDDRPIVGIAGVSLLRNYLVSIDAAGSKLTLRPLDSEQRTLRNAPPIASTAYRTEMTNIWIPATVNGVEGFVHYDTGSPYFFALPEVLEQGNGLVDSLVIGGTNLAATQPQRPDAAPLSARPKDLGQAYQTVPLNVIAQLGNDASDRWIITIDPRDTRLYFESPR